MPAGWATLGAAAIGAVGSIAGGANAASAAGQAANVQKEAASAAIGEQRQTRYANQYLMKPYTDIGSASANKLSNLLGLNAENPAGITLPDGRSAKQAAIDLYQQVHGNDGNASFATLEATDPSSAQYVLSTYIPAALKQAGIDPATYSNSDTGALTRKFTQADLNADVPYNTSLQFGLDEGTKAISRSAAANGGLDSGAALKALTRYATDYTGTKATDAYSRFTGGQQQQYNMLTGQEAAGQGAAGTVAGSNANAAGNVGNYLTQAGNAGAAGIVGGANAFSAGLNGAGNNLLLAALTGGGQRSADFNNYGGSGMNPYATGMSDMSRQLYGTGST
jgi:hypothetical protein